MTTTSKDFNKVAGTIKAKVLPPYSIWLTAEERAALERAAAGLPLGAVVRERHFGSDLEPRSMPSSQKFAAAHAAVFNHFNQERSLSSRHIFKQNRSAALAEWRGLGTA